MKEPYPKRDQRKVKRDLHHVTRDKVLKETCILFKETYKKRPIQRQDRDL